MTALTIKNLSHAFDKETVLDKVSLSIKEGQFTALLGLNGAGKTTLFSLVTRLFAHQTGEVRLFGHRLDQEPRQALTHLGVVFQMPTLDLDLSVKENLLYHGALHGMSRSLTHERMIRELKRLGLAQDAHKRVRTLSGGQRRRVEIARALLHQPRFLLLDEPTVGLDIDSRKIITDHIHHLCQKEGLAALWATHLIDEITPQDDLIILHRGVIKMMGETAQLLKKHKKKNLNDLFAAAIGKKEQHDQLS